MMTLLRNLQYFVTKLDVNSITSERKQILRPLINYIQQKNNEEKPIRLNFICTHNSRRSHFTQIWAQTLAYYFGINNIYCYSGGTEATAIYPMVIETLENVGFQIEILSDSNNSIYNIKYAYNELPIIGFSKKMDALFNPHSEFCAIMTCSQADEGCPFVPGAEQRILITYDDPKVFDNTLQKAEKYKERNLQIATEMFYIFSKIK